MDESELRKRDQPPSRPVDLRASDTDRDRVADILRDAFAEGRLTPDEHSARLDLVYAAKTVGELQPLVRDLPAGQPVAAPVPPAAPAGSVQEPDPRAENPNLVGIMGGSERKGHWRVGHTINAVAIMGGVVIDPDECVLMTR